MIAYALMFLVGQALIVWGAWEISHPVGLIVSGIALVVLGVAFAQSETIQKEEKK